MLVNEIHAAELNSSVQTFKASVGLYKGSTLEKICDCSRTLNEFTIERTGEGKFFGFGICQKLRVSIIDENKELNITKEHSADVVFTVDGDSVWPFPLFYVDEAERDEETGDLTIVAYDALYKAENHTVAELTTLSSSYTLETFLAACAEVLGLSYDISAITDGSFNTMFSAGANFDNTESIRQALNAIAEATQSIYYINSNLKLVFKRLDKEGEPVFTIDRSNYFDLKTSGARVLGAVVHTTQLEDSVTAIEPGETVEGVTQYIRDNPFWDLREDIADLVEAAQAVAAGISIEQFECDWFGNYLLEIGDKIKLISKDNRTLYTYFLDDSITFNGAIEQHTKWIYNEDDAETAANPTSLGEALNKTYARVDKVNQEIKLVASRTEANAEQLSSLTITTSGISTEVEAMRKNTNDMIANTNEGIVQLRTEIEQSAENIKIAVQQELQEESLTASGVKTKETGFTFDDRGLTIDKTEIVENPETGELEERHGEIKTTITENGMYVYKNETEALVANNQGVTATDLHAKTYLIINGNSRFENYIGLDGSNRTGCFWIGG